MLFVIKVSSSHQIPQFSRALHISPSIHALLELIVPSPSQLQQNSFEYFCTPLLYLAAAIGEYFL